MRPILLPLLLSLPLLWTGCTRTTPAPPGPPPDEPPAVVPRWTLEASDVVYHRLERARGGEILTIKYTRSMPVPLGETAVSDLVLAIRNPVAPRSYEVVAGSRELRVALARAPELGNRRTGLLYAKSGTVTLEARQGEAFAGHARLRFEDPLHDGATYDVVARFGATRR
jgi:hypothetical protein